MRRLVLGLLFAAACLSVSRLAAADPHPARPVVAAAAPGRVGRVAVVSGTVELAPAAAGSWSAAEPNDPIAARMAVRTGPRSQASIEIGIDSIDLAAGGKIAIAALDPRGAVLELASGHVGLVLNRRAGAVEVVLPRGEAWLSGSGAFDIDAGGSGAPTRIVAFAGSARYFGQGVEIAVAPGEAVAVADAAPLSLTITTAAADASAASRLGRNHQSQDLAVSAGVSPDLTGLSALAGAGHWRHTPSDGEVWVPDSMPVGWRPYREGRWRWFEPWGWTWIDDAPWGFAPSHYGRWTRIDGRWAWAPGDLAANRVYVPAVVAFLGTAGIGISYAGGSGPAIGWFPLAPGEVYWPSYTSNLGAIRNINRADIADIAAIRPQPDGRLPVEVVDRPFANRLAASVVPRRVFADSRPVQPALIELPEERLREAPVVMGSPRIVPPAPPPLVVAGNARPAPAVPPAAAATAGRARWRIQVALAAIRSGLYRRAAQLRHLVVLELRPAEPQRLRHLVALRLAPHRPEHEDKHKDEHKHRAGR